MQIQAYWVNPQKVDYISDLSEEEKMICKGWFGSYKRMEYSFAVAIGLNKITFSFLSRREAKETRNKLIEKIEGAT
jgi:hypothetical protein